MIALRSVSKAKRRALSQKFAEVWNSHSSPTHPRVIWRVFARATLCAGAGAACPSCERPRTAGPLSLSSVPAITLSGACLTASRCCQCCIVCGVCQPSSHKTTGTRCRIGCSCASPPGSPTWSQPLSMHSLHGRKRQQPRHWMCSRSSRAARHAALMTAGFTPPSRGFAPQRTPTSRCQGYGRSEQRPRYCDLGRCG